MSKFNTNLDKIAPTVSEYRLPSQGLAYGGSFPSTIKIKPYSFVTESILVTNLSSTEKIVAILKAVAEFPEDFDPYDTLIPDQYMILAIARALTYSEKYIFDATCTYCGTKETVKLAVPDEIPCKFWVSDPVEKTPSKKSNYPTESESILQPGEINIKDLQFRLPVCKDTVTIRPLSLRDNESSMKYADEAKKLKSAVRSPLFMRQHAMRVKSLNGVDVSPEDYKYIEEQWLPRLIGQDLAMFRERIDALEPGIVTTWNMVCPNQSCGRAYDAFIPIIGNFFR